MATSEDKDEAHAMSLLAMAFEILGRRKTLPELMHVAIAAVSDAHCAASDAPLPSRTPKPNAPSKPASPTDNRSKTQKKWDRMGPAAREKARRKELEYLRKKAERVASHLPTSHPHGTPSVSEHSSPPSNDPPPPPPPPHALDSTAPQGPSTEEKNPGSPVATAKGPGEKRLNSERTPNKAPLLPTPNENAAGATGATPQLLESMFDAAATNKDMHMGEENSEPKETFANCRDAVRRGIDASIRWRALLECKNPNVLERVLVTLSLELRNADSKEWVVILRERMGKVAGRICREEGVWLEEPLVKKVRA